MRLLSTRLSHMQRVPQASSRQIRHASRYSNPTKRSFTAVPNQPSFFVTPASADHAAHGLQGDFARQHPTDPARNPLDARAVQIAAEEKRQYHMHRMRYAGIGLLLTLLGLGATLYNLDLDDMDRSKGKISLDASSEANKQFQGKEVHIVGAGEGKRIVAQGKGEDIELVETGTSSVPHFPRTIYLPANPDGEAVAEIAQPNTPVNPGNISNQEQYTLLGLGIRTVSFLSIQVYVVGMYVRTQDISALQEELIHRINPTASTLVPSEKESLQKALLDPATSKEIWNELLTVPGLKTAWRLSPTRNTDFMHLRDGWVTGINKRTAEAKQALRTASPPVAQESEYDSDAFGLSMRNFMNLFAGGKAPKGSVMILNRAQNGALDVFFQGQPDGKTGEERAVQRLGRVEDERIGKLIWLNYLAGDKVSSEAARKGVVDGCVSFAGRPVGSVETMVT